MNAAGKKEFIGSCSRESLESIAKKLYEPLLNRDDVPDELRIYCTGLKEGRYVASIINKKLAGKRVVFLQGSLTERTENCYMIDIDWFIERELNPERS